MPRSTRPAATSLIASETSDGEIGCTSRPAAAKNPLSIPVYRPTWSGFGYQSSWIVTFCGGGAPGEPAVVADPDDPQDDASRATTSVAKSRFRMVCIPPLA